MRMKGKCLSKFLISSMFSLDSQCPKIPNVGLLTCTNVQLKPWFLRAWLNYNVMFYQTFICFCLNEAKRLCLNYCSWLLDDAE